MKRVRKLTENYQMEKENAQKNIKQDYKKMSLGILTVTADDSSCETIQTCIGQRHLRTGFLDAFTEISHI